MTSARLPLPTDLVALVTFDGRVYPNEARTMDRMGLDHRARPLETALEQWFSFATGKHTWVSVHGATIRGLISARRRARPSVWEVDVLIDTEHGTDVPLTLFKRMTDGISKLKAERVFLRLECESPLVEAASAAGFFTYSEQTLYSLDLEGVETEPIDLPLRPRAKNDLFGIYQLYDHTVPANVRAIEGATLREWQAAQERWGGRTTDYVLEDDAIITALVRARGGETGRFAVLAQEGLPLGELVTAGLARLKNSQSALTLVHRHEGALASILKDRGFQPVAEYALMARRLAQPAEELAKQAARKAIPVS